MEAGTEEESSRSDGSERSSNSSVLPDDFSGIVLGLYRAMRIVIGIVVIASVKWTAMSRLFATPSHRYQQRLYTNALVVADFVRLFLLSFLTPQTRLLHRYALHSSSTPNNQL